MILRDIAPRLARARDQWIAEQTRLYVERRLAEHRWHEARRRLDHRELQLLRSVSARRPRSYISQRQRKLDEARRLMREASDAVAAVRQAQALEPAA